MKIRTIVSFVALIAVAATSMAAEPVLQQSCWIKQQQFSCKKGDGVVIVTAADGKKGVMCRPAHLPLLSNEKACTAKEPSAPTSLPQGATPLPDEKE